MLEVQRIEIPRFGENCYLIINPSKQALIVDPGGEAEQMMAIIDQHQLCPQAIILTHGHFDHIGAVDTLREHFNIDVYIHQLEHDFLTNPELNLSGLFPKLSVTQSKPDHVWTEMGQVNIGEFSFVLHHIPGHSPGSVVYRFPQDKFIIGGDTLFQGSIGRTDFPGGSMELLLTGIRNELLSLEDDYVVYPGHGPTTTIGKERYQNAFLQ